MRIRIGLLIVMLLASITAHAQQWTKMAAMLAAHSGHGAATGPDGMIYVVGGLAGQTQCVASMEMYNPLTNTWSSAPSMSAARCHPSVVTGADGYIYVIGGDLGNTSTNMVERYDTKAKTWKPVASMNVKRGRPAVGVGPDLRIYAMGGYESPSSTDHTEIEVYDPTTDLWIMKQPTAPGARVAATRLDGNINAFTFGGGGQWAIFDGAWNAQGGIQPSSNGVYCVTDGPDGLTYLLGVGTGSVLSGSSGAATLDAGGNFNSIADLLESRGSAGAAASAEGRVFITGGYRKASPGQLPYVESYGPLRAQLYPGVTAWYRFNEPGGAAIVDSFGPTTGAIVGAALRIPGRVKQALSFNGKNQYVKIDNAPPINFGTGDLTIEGWMKWTNTGLHVTTVLDKRTLTSGKYQGYSLFIYKNRLGLQLANGDTYVNYGASSTTIDPNQWAHFAVTLDRTAKKLTFYVNGVVDTSQHVPLTGNITNTAPLTIAGHSLDPSYYTGALDEITFYNKALRWAEIRAIFLAGREGH